MTVFKANVVLELEVDDTDPATAVTIAEMLNGIRGRCIFCGPLRRKDEDVLLSRMVKIKEKVKEVYAKLKQLHVKKNVNLYYDLLEAILRS